VHDLAFPVDLFIDWTDNATHLNVTGNSNLIALYYTPPSLTYSIVLLFLNNVLVYSLESSMQEIAFLNVTIDPDQDPGLSLVIFTQSLVAVDSGSLSSVRSS
jgi:hypothetical protein